MRQFVSGIELSGTCYNLINPIYDYSGVFRCHGKGKQNHSFSKFNENVKVNQIWVIVHIYSYNNCVSADAF